MTFGSNHGLTGRSGRFGFIFKAKPAFICLFFLFPLIVSPPVECCHSFPRLVRGRSPGGVIPVFALVTFQ